MSTGESGARVNKSVRGPQPNFLRAWREAAGLTQAQVEKILRWHPAHVSHLERGQARITQKILEMLAPLYGCAPPDLLISPLEHSDHASNALALLRDAEANLQKLLADFDAMKERLHPLLDTFSQEMAGLNARTTKVRQSAVETATALAEATALLRGQQKRRSRQRASTHDGHAVEPAPK